MSDFKVLVTDYAWPSLDLERGVLSGVNAELVVAKTGEEDELVKLAPPVDAILTCWKSVTPAVLNVAERCVMVSRYGIGLDNIAVARATELGLIVTNVPDFCLEEVSDHVMAVLLACARRVVQFDRATSQGMWNLQAERSIPRLRGQTLGLVGFGNTARTVARKARALGLQVVAYTPRLTSASVGDDAVRAPSLDALLATSDYVSIHVPLTDETRGLFDAARLQAMKSSAYLINTSRGAVIDESALLAALNHRTIAGAALDVLIEEPPPSDHPLILHDKVLATPHAAFYSEAAIAELARRASEHVAEALGGSVPTHIVNRTVLDQDNLRLQRLS